MILIFFPASPLPPECGYFQHEAKLITQDIFTLMPLTAAHMSLGYDGVVCMRQECLVISMNDRRMFT